MARKRMIDPSIWQDEGMAELTPRQQILYIGLFSNADDEGRLKGSAAYIRLILPTIYGGESLDAVADDIAAVMANMQRLIAYEADGKPHLAFVNYAKWQKIDRPQDSRLPAPSLPYIEPSSTNDRETLDERSTNDRETLDPRVEESRGIEVSTEEKNVEESATADHPLRSAALSPAQKSQADNFSQALTGINGFQPTTEFMAKVVTKYGVLDLEESALAIAGYAKKRPKWMNNASILNWLKNDLERLEHPQERSTANGRLNTARNGPKLDSDDRLNAFDKFA